MIRHDSADHGFLSDLLPEGLRSADGPLESTLEDLFPAERELVARAVTGRQSEFATGRVLARRLLADLGHARFPLLRDADRVPLWPDSVHGSISHTAGRCIVAVGRSERIRGLGLDIEPDEPIQPGIDRRVCVESELAWLNSVRDEVERGRQCRLVFSAKEAVYKAFFPRVREFWGFHDVALQFDLDRARFEACLPASAGRPSIEGRFARRDGFVVTAVVDERPH